MKCSFKIFVIMAFCLCLFPLKALASEEDISNTINNNTNIFVNLNEILGNDEFTKLQEDLLRHMYVLSESGNTEELPKYIDFKNTVRVTEVDDISSSGIKIRTDRCLYRIPLAIDTGYIYSTLIYKEGKITSYESAVTLDTSLCQTSYLFETNMVSNVIIKFSNIVSNISVMTIPNIRTDFIYFLSEGKAFVIPFSSRPDFLKLENGIVYPYEIFVENANALLKEISDGSVDSLLGNQGGSGGSVNRNLSNIIYCVMIICTITLLVSYFINFIVKRKTKHII